MKVVFSTMRVELEPGDSITVVDALGVETVIPAMIEDHFCDTSRMDDVDFLKEERQAYFAPYGDPDCQNIRVPPGFLKSSEDADTRPVAQPSPDAAFEARKRLVSERFEWAYKSLDLKRYVEILDAWLVEPQPQGVGYKQCVLNPKQAYGHTYDAEAHYARWPDLCERLIDAVVESRKDKTPGYQEPVGAGAGYTTLLPEMTMQLTREEEEARRPRDPDRNRETVANLNEDLKAALAPAMENAESLRAVDLPPAETHSWLRDYVSRKFPGIAAGYPTPAELDPTDGA